MSRHPVFPSREWFERLAEGMHAAEPSYRNLGSLDCTMVVKVDGPANSTLYEVAFEGFGVKSVRRLASLAEAAADHFVLEAPLTVWREMIDNIRANGTPDLEHTLNYLTFPDDPMRVTGPDQLEIDAFYRYNQSLQRFFNESAAVETSFAE